MSKRNKMSRLVIAKQKDNLEKSIAVQIKYRFNHNPWISEKINDIEVYSVSGLTRYKVLKVQYEGRRIVFLYGVLSYVIDLKS
ncbi:hypothetical protein [Acinetobacter sp.]|jgi:hypothetical protein|uniref:Uncharacterized protein n=1 Tax=Acinetobacter bereziniae TaxID=106648 RepID=A0A833PF22_ACIBZ|nr:hypothetical protein [Acinetobacter sp.]KAF1024614.1 MAG: hypothetical protein GAK29_02462 [Acinetobacter bereziniae]MDR0237832.1 hypothetical protein [Acinetobacter sp.]